MTLTRFPHGISSMGVPMFGNFVTLGNSYFVKPSTGSDGNTGEDIADAAKKTIAGTAGAYAMLTANQNDTVYLVNEGNTAALSTDYQSTTLTWAKNSTRLIGVNSGSMFSNRARFAWLSTASSASDIPLFTLSASNCYFENIQWFAGINDANLSFNLNITGSRNVFRYCHIAGIGHDTNDATGAYSLLLDGAQECYFDHCVIGLDTIDAGTAENSDILFDGAAKYNIFENCLIIRRIEHATNHPLVKIADATAIDGFNLFKNCGFITTATNYGYTLSGVFKFVATPTQGLIVLDNCYAVNDNSSAAGKWDVDDLDKICIIGNPTPAADSCGLIRVV